MIPIDHMDAKKRDFNAIVVTINDTEYKIANPNRT